MSGGFEAKFKEAIQAAGLEFVGDIIPDGKLHRCHVEGHRKGTKNGWYVRHGDDFPCGVFGDHKSGIKGDWSFRDNNTYTPRRKSGYSSRSKTARQQSTAMKT